MKSSNHHPSVVPAPIKAPPRKSVAPSVIAHEAGTPAHSETTVRMGAKASVFGYGGSFWCSCTHSTDAIEPGSRKDEKTQPSGPK